MGIVCRGEVMTLGFISEFQFCFGCAGKMFSKAAVQLHRPQNNNTLKWLVTQRGIV